MSKKLWTAAILALGLVLVMAGMAAAAKYQNLTGTWSGNLWAVYWNNGTYDYYQAPDLVLVVTNQDENGTFYGTFDGDPLTGSIATNKAFTACVYVGSGRYGIINGKLTGKKIQGTFNDFTNSFIQTLKFELFLQP
jgi:hypothetical protein